MKGGQAGEGWDGSEQKRGSPAKLKSWLHHCCILSSSETTAAGC